MFIYFKVFKVEIILLLASYILLSAQGVGNYLLSNGLFSAWKQVIIVSLIVLCIFKNDYMRSPVLLFAIVSAIVLTTNTYSEGLSLSQISYNLFFYIGWVPFFLMGQKIDLDNRQKIGMLFIALIIISALGLWLQLTTPILDFLKTQDEAEYRDITGDAQRFYFVYVVSTGVMPTLAAFFCFTIIAKIKSSYQIIALIALATAALATASLAAFIMLSFCFLMLAVALQGRSRLILVSAFGVMLISLPLLTSDTFSKQIDRVVTNRSDSESNVGRLELWSDAVNLIGDASITELVFGYGIGSTNSNGNLKRNVLPHGESSYFQAMIEGGILGLILRLMPTVLLFAFARRLPDRLTIFAYAAGVFICCAVAPIFSLYGVQCGLGLLSGYVAGASRRNGVSQRGWQSMPVMVR